ncbi:MAG TPA: hypothetical protein VNX01_00180 [Bacteroidia bacterium]|nr:hypothetical protein [Bacteroidia bacterium]
MSTKHKTLSLLFVLVVGFAYSQTGTPQKKDNFIFLNLFFKPNSLNFDTLSNYHGRKLPISDTNQIIDYMVKYITTSSPHRIIGLIACVDENEKTSEELAKQRAEKVTNLLIQRGVPKDKIKIQPCQTPTCAQDKIQFAKKPKEKEEMLKEKEELKKTKPCVTLSKMKIVVE